MKRPFLRFRTSITFLYSTPPNVLAWRCNLFDESNRMQPLRLAFLGAGIFARDAHLPSLRNLRDRFAITAVYSRTAATAQSLADEIGPDVKIYTDLTALLMAPDIDAVDVVLPIPVMPPVVAQALASGIDVGIDQQFQRCDQRVEFVVVLGCLTGSFVRSCLRSFLAIFLGGLLSGGLLNRGQFRSGGNAAQRRSVRRCELGCRRMRRTP